MRALCQNFVDVVYSYKREMLQKPKFHLLLHLAENMTEFGPTAAFNTERYIFSTLFETRIIIIMRGFIIGVKPSIKSCDHTTFTATERHPAVILQ